MTKDTDEWSDEEIHRVRSGMVLNSRASVLVEWRYTTPYPQHIEVFTKPEAL